ncbi:MAG: BlaI/MecI/CopY family transcriptional regulator [Flavobacteriaceae bacterium]
MKSELQKLTNKEEEVMKVLWKLKKGFVKDILKEYSGSKPHYNTLSTIVRHLEDKKYVGYEAFGNTHRYFPLVSREDYRKRFVNKTVADFYDNSYKNMVSFFAKEQKITAEELREIIDLIEKNK